MIKVSKSEQTELYPLKFEPIYKERIWGGAALADYFHRKLPQDKLIGESWDLADVGQDKSIVSNGFLKGKNIAEVIAEYNTSILGAINYKPPFGLLIKILDAQQDLSVQVHPDAKACLRMGKGQLKTECWYIIDAKPGAVIYKGLKKGVSGEDFQNAIKSGDVAELLNKVPVAPDECHFLPAGTPHAIGAGLLIAEIQTPSDTTYRVFDWNRVDDSGKPRQLHIQEALESINFAPDESELTVRSIGRLVECDYFTIDKGHQEKNCEMLLDKGKMKVLVILQGQGSITDINDNSVNFQSGETLLIPACYTGAVHFTEETYYLKVSL